ncbi:putative transcription factor WD40-like family [Dioscorea sansibarensis]
MIETETETETIRDSSGLIPKPRQTGAGSVSSSDDRDTEISTPPVPGFNDQPFSRLISFPNNDILGDLTDDQLNVLIFQHLKEKGFQQSAYVFGEETKIESIPIDKSIIDEGALPSFVHKGLRYTQLDANVHASDTNSFIECCRLDPLDIITNSVDSLSKIIKSTKENAKKKKDDDRGKDIYRGVSDQEKESEKQNLGKDKEHGQDMRMQQGSMHLENQSKVDVHGGFFLCLESNNFSSGSWFETGRYFDSAAQIWKISDDFSSMRSSLPSVCVLNDYNAKTDGQSGSNSLAWNGEGELLATGSFDGHISIWSKNGELKGTLKHGDCIFSLEWNRIGGFLLSGSSDDRIIVWDTTKWESKQEFQFGSEKLLGVTWRNNTSFAVFSGEQRIYVCNVGESLPIKTSFGHQKVLGGIKWDPDGTYLASFSIDGAIKIWTLKQRRSLHNLMHSPSVCSIKWRPTGSGTNNPDKQLLLASASFDGTVKIWDCNQGHLLYSFNGHRGPVTAIEFSPDGEYLASGAEDQRLLIWKVKDGAIVKSCSCHESIVYNVSWHGEGNKLAASFENGTVCVIALSLDQSSVH